MIRTRDARVLGAGASAGGAALFSLDVSDRRVPFSLSRGDVGRLDRGAAGRNTDAVIGLDKLDPKRTYMFMSNHVSNIDPPIMLPLIPRRTSVMVKKELFDYPLLGKT